MKKLVFVKFPVSKCEKFLKVTGSCMTSRYSLSEEDPREYARKYFLAFPHARLSIGSCEKLVFSCEILQLKPKISEKIQKT